MISKLYLILFLMFGISIMLIAQNGVISGRVYDASTKEPLIAAYQYNSDGTRDKIYQFSLLPVFGLEMEF